MDEESIRAEIAVEVSKAIGELKEVLKNNSNNDAPQVDAFEEYMKTVKGLTKKED